MATEKSTENYCHLKALEMKKKIMDLVYEQMAAKGMNPTDVAKRAGMPTSTISRILSGQRGRDPTLLVVLRIYYALDVPLEHLLKKLLP